MAPTYTPLQVQRAIQLMYTASNAEQRKQAVEWLHVFASDSSAWELSFSLISGNVTDEVRFFCANMVYGKLRKEWTQQSEMAKQELHAHLFRVLQQYVSGGENPDAQGKISQNVIQRICLCIAAITVLTPPLVASYVDKAKMFLAKALEQRTGSVQQSFQQGVSVNAPSSSSAFAQSGGAGGSGTESDRAYFVATEMIRVLPEEKEAMHPAEASVLLPDSIDGQLREALPELIQLLQRMEPIQKATAMLRCIGTWAPLGISLVILRRDAPMLLREMLQTLGSDQTDRVEAGSYALESVVKTMSPEMQLTGEAGAEEVGVLREVSREIVGICRDGLKRAVEKEKDNRRALAICRAITAFAERHTALIVNGTAAELTSLADLIFDCTRFPNHEVSGSTLDFWLAVQDIPMHERHETFRKPCYHELLKILVDQCCVPADAEPGNLPYEADHYRVVAGDVFVSIFFVLRSNFFQILLALLNKASIANNASAAESILFAAEAVASEATDFLKAKQTSGPESGPVREGIVMLLRQVASSPLTRSSAMVLGTTARLHGALAKLLPSLYIYYQYSSPSDAVHLLQQSLGCCVISLKHANVCLDAAAAMLKICTSCAKELAKLPELLESVVTEINQVVQGGMAADARVYMIRGMLRVSSEMSDESMKTAFIASLLNPGIHRLKIATGQGRTDAERAPTQIVPELKCLEAYIAFAQSSVVIGLMAEIWPLTEQLYSNPALMKEPEVGESLFRLLSGSFVAASDVLKDKAAGILKACSDQYQLTGGSCYIECMSKAVEMYGRLVEMQQVLADLIVNVSRQTFALYDNKETKEHPDVVEKFFELVYLYFLFCPRVLFTSSEFANIWKLGIMCMTVQESGPHRAVLMFLQKSVSKAAQLDVQPAREAILQQMVSLLAQAIHGLVAASPSAHFPRFSALLLQVLLFDTVQSPQWMYKALRENSLVSAKLSEEQSRQLVQRLLGDMNNPPSLDATVTAFARVVRDELPLSSLQLG